MKETKGFELSLESYCEYCGDFTPCVESTDITCLSDRVSKYIHKITCENAYKCKLLNERMKKGDFS